MGVYMDVEPADLPMDWEDVVRSIRMKPYIDKLWGTGPVMFLLEGTLGFCPNSPNLFQELHG